MLLQYLSGPFIQVSSESRRENPEVGQWGDSWAVEVPKAQVRTDCADEEHDNAKGEHHRQSLCRNFACRIHTALVPSNVNRSVQIEILGFSMQKGMCETFGDAQHEFGRVVQ